MGMEAVITASLGLVVSITTAVQNVTALRQRCSTLATQVQALQPFLKEVLEQARLKNRGEKLFSPGDETAFQSLYAALERANRIVQDLKRTNRIKLLLMASALSDEFADVSNDIQECLSSMTLVGLQIAADMKATIDKAKSSLVKLRDDLKEESTNKAIQLRDLEEKIMDAIQQHGGSLLNLLRTKEPLQILADHFDTDPDTIKTDLQALPEFVEWRITSKKAVVQLLFEQILILFGELDGNSWSVCHKAWRIGTMPDLECPICCQQFTNPVIISSGLTYCSECIERALGTEMKCPVSRQVVSHEMFRNRAVESILRMPDVGSLPEETRSPRQAVKHTRWDFQTVAREFQSSTSGTAAMSLIALQAHSETLEGKKKIISTKDLVSSLVDHVLSASNFERKLCLQILDALTSVPKVGGASSSSAPETALTNPDLDEVFSCLKAKDLQNLVGLMMKGPPSCRVLAAKVMANVIEGSLDCLFIASRTLTGLVTAFFELAVKSGDSSRIGVEGLILLSTCGQRHNTGDIRQRDETLIRVLMDLTRYEIALEESLVALGTAVVCYKGPVSGLLEDVSHLVSLVADLPIRAETNAVMNILVRMANESINEGRQDKVSLAVPLREIVESFVPTLLSMLKGGPKENGDSFEVQEKCITLLGYVCKYGSWRLEPEEVPCMFDIILQDTASNESRIEVLNILAEYAENRRLWRHEVFAGDRVKKLLELIKPQPTEPSLRSSIVEMLYALLKAPIWLEEILRAGGVEALCTVVANDEDPFCRSYAIIALERLPRTDAMKQTFRTKLCLKQLMQLFRIQGVDDETAYEAKGAAAALMGILDTDTESEPSMIEAMAHLVEFLRGKALVWHKEKAAEALADLLSKAGEIAQEWFVTSDSNVLSVLLDVVHSTNPVWRGKLYESLALLCIHVDGQKAVIEAQGQRLLLEALQAGSQNAAVALAALLVREEHCLGVDLDRVVIWMKLRLQRKDVDPVMVEAFAKLCSTVHTGISVEENGGIEVLLDLIQRSPDCCAAAAHALTKLASVKFRMNVDVDSPSELKRWKAQIVAHQGVEILFNVAGRECIEAVEALAALADEASAKTRLVEKVPKLIDMCRDGGRMQDLVLQILMHLSGGSLSQDSVSNLVFDGFPELLIRLLKTPAYPVATTAVRIVRNCSIESSEFRKAMLSSGEGVVNVLLEVLKGPVAVNEIGEYSVIALEIFMKDDMGRQQLIDADGIHLLANVLQQKPVPGRVKFYALRVLLLLSDPPLRPKTLRKKIWSQISAARIIGALGQAMEINYPIDSSLAGIQLIRACVQEISGLEVSALCWRLRDAGVLRSLSRLQSHSDWPVFYQANVLVEVLARKSSIAWKALKEGVDKLPAFEEICGSLDGGPTDTRFRTEALKGYKLPVPPVLKSDTTLMSEDGESEDGVQFIRHSDTDIDGAYSDTDSVGASSYHFKSDSNRSTSLFESDNNRSSSRFESYNSRSSSFTFKSNDSRSSSRKSDGWEAVGVPRVGLADGGLPKGDGGGGLDREANWNRVQGDSMVGCSVKDNDGDGGDYSRTGVENDLQSLGSSKAKVEEPRTPNPAIRNENLRPDIIAAGFRDFDATFDPNRILCLFRKYAPPGGVHVAFFHPDGMARVLGIGVACSVVRLNSEPDSNVVHVDELTEEEWKQLWKEPSMEFYSAVLFKLWDPGSESGEPSKLSTELSPEETLQTFGLDMLQTDVQVVGCVPGKVETSRTQDVCLLQMLIRSMTDYLPYKTGYRERKSPGNGISGLASGCIGGIGSTTTDQTIIDRGNLLQTTSSELHGVNIDSRRNELAAEDAEDWHLTVVVCLNPRDNQIRDGANNVVDDPALKDFNLKTIMTVRFIHQPEEEVVKAIQVTLAVEYQLEMIMLDGVTQIFAHPSNAETKVLLTWWNMVFMVLKLTRVRPWPQGEKEVFNRQ